LTAVLIGITGLIAILGSGGQALKVMIHGDKDI